MQAVRGDSGERVARVIAEHVIDVPGFPQDGVVFKDLSPLFADGLAFREITDALVERYSGSFDMVAGIEARGFLLAASLAYATSTGVVLVRKAGKLPRETHSASYDLEYGTATLEVQADAFVKGHRVLVVDDVLATGGTAEATMSLVEQAGGSVAGFTVLLELGFLKGRERLGDRSVHALLTV
jgi:adenine phosphoribosyltransferase